MKTVKVLLIGAGDRGANYARLLKRVAPSAQIVGVAEPQKSRREFIVSELGVKGLRVFDDWSQALAVERFADAAIIATPDDLHTDPALACLEKGYHLLLEKPIAPTASECIAISNAVVRSKLIFAVGHVLRYSDYTQRLKLLTSSGLIGEIMAVQRLEPIGFDHFAHSYVRGNWRREDLSSFSLLTKACHDLDWLRHIFGRPCEQVTSFGELRHFTREHRPKGATNSCLDCKVERSCPYSAKKIYLDRALLGERGWPLSVVTQNPSPHNLVEALRTGPYGRCVYACDNDVADTQLVNLTFEGGGLATFIMTAFAPMEQRRTTIFGSRGQLVGDGRFIVHTDFLMKKPTTYDTLTDDAELLGGHGGGDGRLLAKFVQAVAEGDPEQILCSPEEVLESHLLTFAAERARREERVVKVRAFIDAQRSKDSWQVTL